MKNTKQLPWQQVSLILAQNTKLSRRAIAKTLDIPRSTCLDYLRKNLK